MAKKPVVRTTCDRCEALIEEDAAEQEPKKPEPPAPPAAAPPYLTLSAERLGLERTLIFSDLCPSCQQALRNIIDRIRLTKKPKPGEVDPDLAAAPVPPPAPPADLTKAANKGPDTQPAPAPKDDNKAAPVDTGASKDAASRGKTKSAN
jgi:hypothetical protein